MVRIQRPQQINNMSKEIYFDGNILYYEGEEIDPDNIPDIMGRNVKEKVRQYIIWRKKGIDMRINNK